MGPATRYSLRETQDPGPICWTQDQRPGTHMWDRRTGILHLGPFSKYSYPYDSYMSCERLCGKEQFRSKKYLLEMTPSRAKLRFNSLSQKRNFQTEKAI